MKIGYVRVSSKDQNPERQISALQSNGTEKLFIEKLSGKDMNRPCLNEMLGYIREGDILIVESYSRLARSTKDFLSIIEKLQEKGVGFISLKEQIDTSTPQGKLMLTVFAGLAQFERECLLQRQSEGIAIAKKAGKYKGRKPVDKPDDWDYVIKLYRNHEITAAQAIKRLSLTKSTFYRLLKKN